MTLPRITTVQQKAMDWLPSDGSYILDEDRYFEGIEGLMALGMAAWTYAGKCAEDSEVKICLTPKGIAYKAERKP